MVNCNPETVSTDYDTADRLYFEPLTFEDVLEVVHAEQQSGHGRRRHLHARRADPARAGAAAQGRRRAGARHPARGDRPGRAPRRVRPGAGRGRAAGAASTAPRRRSSEAKAVADAIGYPVLVRPSYVLGGRGMEIVYDEAAPARLHQPGHRDHRRPPGAGRPVPRRRGRDRRRRALRRHRALPRRRDGAHRGGRHPLRRLGLRAAADHARAPATSTTVRALDAGASPQGVGVRGLLNVQYALAGDVLYVLEANPRASRTVPFVSKATAVPLAKAAARIAVGATIAELRAEGLLPAHRRRRRPARRRADRGEGGGAAVPPVPHARRRPGRLDPRPGDEVDRRGHGLRRDVRHRVREVAGRGLRLAADQGHGVRQHRQPRQAGGDLPGQAAVRPRLPRSWPPPAPRRCCAATASTPRWSASSATGPGNVVEKILAGEVDLVLNTPWGSGGPAAGRLRDPHRRGRPPASRA